LIHVWRYCKQEGLVYITYCKEGLVSYHSQLQLDSCLAVLQVIGFSLHHIKQRGFSLHHIMQRGLS